LSNSKFGKPDPFWVDEPSTYPKNLSLARTRFFKIWAYFMIGFVDFVVLWFVFLLLSKLLALILGVIFLFSLVNYAYQIKKRKVKEADIIKVQQRAQELTRASKIGSAIHVAGHPKLLRDQNIVLALVENTLSIYGYDSPTPIDVIPVEAI
jgi:predicted membrane protein